MTEALLKNLPIEQLQASPTNPRQHFDRASLDELKASIAESGVQIPLLVRMISTLTVSQVRELEDNPERDPHIYEVVAGERRFRVAQELGLAKLPCLVRELTDEEARECQIIENLQRADVPAIEEAEAFGELLGRLGSIAAVAAKLGKEQPYVAKSLRLLKLTLHSRDALRGGLITIDHALLLARLAETEQNDALKWTLDLNACSKTPVAKVLGDALTRIKAAEQDERNSRYRWEPESVVKLKLHIEEEGGVKLNRAPWKLDADTLIDGVVPCDECPKNTKANAPLFGDLDMGDPTCTDGACFAAKTAAFVQIAQSAAGHDPKGGTLAAVPRLSWKSSSVKPSIVSNGSIDPKGLKEMANPAKLLKYGQWIDAKKGSCPNVRSGVTADWSDSGDRGYMGSGQKLRKPGETLQACIAVGCKVHRKGWEKPKSSSSGGHSGPSQQEREAAEAAREKLQAQIAQVEPKIRKLVFQAIVRKLDAPRALRMANDDEHRAAEMRKWMMECLPNLSGEQLEAFTAFGCCFGGNLAVNAYYMAGGHVDEARRDLWKLAKQVGVNADQVAAKAFHDGLTPSLICLYPKGVPWPGQAKAVKTGAPAKAVATKTPVKKMPAKKVAKKTPKKLSPEGRKRIADAMKKRWAERSKKGAKVAARVHAGKGAA